jgi:hypothetical protein
MAMAQKYVKVVQSGYTIPIRKGSKLIMKCTTTKSEFFNSKAFAKLDEVKTMEDGYTLADLASLINYAEYAHLDPIGNGAWSQHEHSKLVAEHEWPSLATKLLRSNNASVYQRGGHGTAAGAEK